MAKYIIQLECDAPITTINAGLQLLLDILEKSDTDIKQYSIMEDKS